MSWPRVLVSIFNRSEGSGPSLCLSTLLNSTFKSLSVVVFDNKSSVDSLSTLHAQFPQVQFVGIEADLGLAAVQNRGLEMATREGYEYVWLLDPDTLVTEGALAALVDALDQDTDTALVSPMIVDGGIYAGIKSCCGVVDWIHFSFESFDTGATSPAYRKPPDGNFYLRRTALLVRVAALSTTGNFDERYFAFCEDIDFSLSALRRCRTIRVVPSARIVHFGHEDMSANGLAYAYYHARDHALFWLKHIERRRRWTFWRTCFAEVLITARRFVEREHAERAHAVLLGTWDAWRGHTGTYDRGRSVPKIVANGLTAHPFFFAAVLRGNFRLAMKKARSRLQEPDIGERR